MKAVKDKVYVLETGHLTCCGVSWYAAAHSTSHMTNESGLSASVMTTVVW